MNVDDAIVAVVFLASAIFLTARNPARSVWLAALAGLRWGAYAAGACILFLFSQAVRRGRLSQLDTRDWWDLARIGAFAWVLGFTATYLILLGSRGGITIASIAP